MTKANYQSLGICDVTEHVHGGPAIEDLLKELVGHYSGQFVVLSPRAEFHVENCLRLAEPQADVYESRSSARKVAATLEDHALLEKGYSAHQITPHFASGYQRRKRGAEEKLGPVAREAAYNPV